MNVIDRNLEIAFSLVSPEKVIDHVKDFFTLSHDDRHCRVGSAGMEAAYYNILSRKIDKDFSREEILNMHEQMELDCKQFEEIPQGLFQLLIRFSLTSLQLHNAVPVCRRERILSWRFVTLKHGQDLFTTSYFAYLAAVGRISGQTCFDWPAIINTDDKRLRAVLQKGIAENHFHLTGSTRVFSLSWIALMNYPEKISHFFDSTASKDNPFAENRSALVSFDNTDRVMSWYDQILYAAWIRMRLFRAVYCKCKEDDIFCDFYKFDQRFDKISTLIDEVKALRLQYGVYFEQPHDSPACLDYAICDVGCFSDATSCDRFLCGERELMYRCFFKIFTNEFGKAERDLFYAYLLFKSRFRSEVIQNNREVGFANFALYQDRKDTFWGMLKHYQHEAQRLAVNSTFKSGAVVSLEMRLQPQKTHKDNFEFIINEDNSILFADEAQRFGYHQNRCLPRESDILLEKESNNLPFFYVLHFIKRRVTKPQDPLPFGWTMPRNYPVRKTARVLALALAQSLSRSGYLCTRIRGIDAASFEIGCRPETFATEFRFLSGFVPERVQPSALIKQSPVMPELGMTYHAGEDFLEMSEGIRAIDEAIRFLHLRRGDRIGHALALGVNPELHYRRKHYFITTTNQDMLDNCVWLMKRSVELGITMDFNLCEILKSEAETLLDKIYGNCISRHGWKISLDDYYASWKLRGDHPLCYFTMAYKHPYQQNIQSGYPGTISHKYYSSFTDGSENRLYRKRENICGLLHYYHYGYEERCIGLQPYTRKVTPEYIRLITCIQDKMQQVLSQKGIVVECNPSSNQLIGTFERYENHPIFRFNRHLIRPDADSYNLAVSLNTDDQGVFDTSLENEYALLADCMSKAMDGDGERKYTDDMIYQYLDHIRDMGIIHTF